MFFTLNGMNCNVASLLNSSLRLRKLFTLYLKPFGTEQTIWFPLRDFTIRISRQFGSVFLKKRADMALIPNTFSKIRFLIEVTMLFGELFAKGWTIIFLRGNGVRGLSNFLCINDFPNVRSCKNAFLLPFPNFFSRGSL